MAENPIPEISDQVLKSIFRNAVDSPCCLIAVVIKDGRLWMQRRTVDFPLDAFDGVVGLVEEDLQKEKTKTLKEKSNGDKTKTRRCRTRR